ncbi:MAG: zinc finger domain-containing protein, partial [Lapillicoccus sp.]
FRPGNQLRQRTWQAIWEDVVTLMALGVSHGQILTMTDQVEVASAQRASGEPLESMESRHYVYKRQGEPCRVCGSRIRTKVVAGRNLFWCGRCQRRR